MNYNVKSKIEQLQKLESNKKAKEIINNASLQENKESVPKPSKKNFTLFLDENLMAEIEEFLSDFGKHKESKSLFVQNALRHYLAHRKQTLKQEIQTQLAKLTN